LVQKFDIIIVEKRGEIEMDTVGGIILFVSIIAFWVFLVMGVIAVIKKSGKGKTNFKRMGMAFGASVLGMILIGIFADTDSETASGNEKPAKQEEVKKEETPEEKAAREQKEKEESEAKAKAEAEKKAKEEAEAKAKAEKEAAEKKAKEEAEAKAKAEAEQKAKEEAAAKKANAKTIEYAQLKKNPDRHAGEYVKYTGEIIQILEGDDITNIRLAVTKDSYGYDFNDLIFIEYPGYTDYVEGDIITVYGEIYGGYSYTSQAGWEITLPGLVADSFE
jgi:flagellar biosynthesis GTPase FlhF